MKSAAVAALCAVVLWSTNAFAATVALERFTVFQLLAVQCMPAALALIIWHVGKQVCKRDRFVSQGRLEPSAVVTGIVGLTGTIFLQYWAFATAPIIGASVIAYGWPLMAALWVAVRVRTRQAVSSLPLAALGFVGVASIFRGHEGVGQGFDIGYLIAVASAVCMAFYTVGAGRMVASVVDLLLPATTVGTVLAVAGSMLEGTPWPPFDQWGSAVYIGLGPMAAGYGLWTFAMAHRRAERLGPLGYLTPLLSTMLLLVTGQPFTTSTLVGAALILACSTGVLINERLAQVPTENAAATPEWAEKSG